MGFFDSFLQQPAQMGGLTLDPGGMDMVRRQAIGALGASLLGANAIQDPGGAFGQGLLGSIGIQQQGMGQQYRIAAEQAERERQAQRDALYAQQIQAQAEAQRALAEYRSRPRADMVQQRADLDLQRDLAFIEADPSLTPEQKSQARVLRMLGGGVSSIFKEEKPATESPVNYQFRDIGGQLFALNPRTGLPVGESLGPAGAPDTQRQTGLTTPNQFDSRVNQYMRSLGSEYTEEEKRRMVDEFAASQLSGMAPEEMTPGLRARATKLGIVPLTDQPPPPTGTPLPSAAPAVPPAQPAPASPQQAEAFTGAKAALDAGTPREQVAQYVLQRYGLTLEQMGL